MPTRDSGAALDADPQLYKLLVEETRELLCLHGVDARCTYLSPGITPLLGYSAEELLGTHPLDLLHPEDRAEAEGALESVLQGQTPVLTSRFRTSKGEYRWIEVQARALRAGDDVVTHLVTSSWDVTRRMELLSRIPEREATLRTVISSFDDLVFVFDPEGRFVEYFQPANRTDRRALLHHTVPGPRARTRRGGRRRSITWRRVADPERTGSGHTRGPADSAGGSARVTGLRPEMTANLRLLLPLFVTGLAWGPTGAEGTTAPPPHNVAVEGRGALPGTEAPDPPLLLSRDTIEGNLSLAQSRELCRSAGSESEEVVDEARRHLEEGTCAAILWVDGLFGPRNDVASARATSGTIEVSSRYSQARGFSPDVRLRLRYHLPNVQRRVNMFLDRDGADDDPVQDRRERFPLRSRVPTTGVDRWMAGLGLSPRGRFQDRIDARAGVRPSSAPTVFTQVRARQQVTHGQSGEVRLRQTGFWESRDGFGVTAGGEYHRLFQPLHLVRFGATGTVSEASDGLEWQGEGAFYRRLSGERTVGVEAFLRGASSRPVPVVEYGFHGLFQIPLQHPHLLGEFIAGVTWPREEVATPRERSLLVGLRLELAFGSD